MISLFSQSGKRVYNVKQYIVDSEEDIDKLPTYCAMGSMARIISTGDTYILNSKKQWIKQKQGASSGSSGSLTEGDDIIILEDFLSTPPITEGEITIIKNNSPSNNDESIIIL